MHFTVVGILYVITILFGLAIGGVMGHWFLAVPIFVIGLIGAVPGLFSGSKTSSIVAFVDLLPDLRVRRAFAALT